MNRLWDAHTAAHTLGAPQVAVMALRDFFDLDADAKRHIAVMQDAEDACWPELAWADGGRDRLRHGRADACAVGWASQRCWATPSIAVGEGDTLSSAIAEGSSVRAEGLAPSQSAAGSLELGGVTDSIASHATLLSGVEHGDGPDAGRRHGAANPGSMGHPDVCAKPCLHAAAGRCANGADCEFCHDQHTTRAKKLDKRDRDALREMPAGAAQRLLLGVLREKVLSIDGSARSLACFEQLAAACGLDAIEHFSLRAMTGRHMRTGLTSMTVRHLLALLESVTAQGNAHSVSAAVQALVVGLQRRLDT